MLGDITDLDYYTVIRLRSLGVEQRREVATGLNKYGLFPTEWDTWLERKKENNEDPQ